MLQKDFRLLMLMRTPRRLTCIEMLILTRMTVNGTINAEMYHLEVRAMFGKFHAPRRWSAPATATHFMDDDVLCRLSTLDIINED